MMKISRASSSHLAHSGSVPLVTAIECIFTDCIFITFTDFFATSDPEQTVLTQVSVDCNATCVIFSHNTENVYLT